MAIADALKAILLTRLSFHLASACLHRQTFPGITACQMGVGVCGPLHPLIHYRLIGHHGLLPECSKTIRQARPFPASCYKLQGMHHASLSKMLTAGSSCKKPLRVFLGLLPAGLLKCVGFLTTSSSPEPRMRLMTPSCYTTSWADL